MVSVEAVAAVRPLEDLRAAVERPGPFVTVVMTMEEPSERAAETTELRWRAVRERLEELEAPGGAIEAIRQAVEETYPGVGALCVVADEDGVVVRDTHLDTPAREFVRFEPVPSLLPVIEWRQLTPPHVVVMADRTGADISVVGPSASAELEIEGDHDVIRKPAPGGWSQRRFQQRAEDSWERNAEKIAGVVGRMAGVVDARLVLLAGDPHAVTLLEGELPDEVRRHVRSVSGSRHAGSERADTEADVLHLVATAASEDTVALLQHLREQLGRGGGAVEGMAATAEALAKAQVQILAVHDDPDSSERLWFGPSPEQVAVESQTLRDLGVEQPRQGRAADVLVRAALGTGASVRVIPAHGGPAEAVGGVLRWEE